MSGEWRQERLTAHFRLGEFYRPGHREPSSAAKTALLLLCRMYLEPLRAEYGRVTVHSGNRGPKHNVAVGGAPRSFHRYALRQSTQVAADVSASRGTPQQWYRLVDLRGPGGLGLYPTHIHVDSRQGETARW